ncbi:hypothetical protein KC19_7G081900, partial [Ceratodon purpureus]
MIRSFVTSPRSLHSGFHFVAVAALRFASNGSLRLKFGSRGAITVEAQEARRHANIAVRFVGVWSGVLISRSSFRRIDDALLSEERVLVSTVVT